MAGVGYRNLRRSGVFVGLKNLFNPYGLLNNTAIYSLADGPSDSTYLIDGSNRLMLVADRSGNSAVNALVTNGVSGNGASSPDSAALDITGTIDMDVFCGVASWTAGPGQVLTSKWASNIGANRAYELLLLSDGKLRFDISPDGFFNAANTVTSSVSTGFANFTNNWVRAKWISSTKTVTFYTSQDGSTWTQLGTTGTTSAGAIFNSAATFNVGGSDGLTASLGAGIFYRTRVYNGDRDSGGTLAFDADFTRVAKLATSFTETSANAATVTINTSGNTGARICGARDRVQMTAAAMPAFSVVNGYNTATYDGNKWMKSAPFPLPQPASIYGVITQTSWNQGLAIWDGNSSSERMLLNQTSTVDGGSSPMLSIYGGTAFIKNSNLPVGVKGVVRAVYNGAASSIGINLGAAVTGNAGANAGNGHTIGGVYDGTFRGVFMENETLIRSVADDVVTDNKIDRFLIKKWGVAA